MTPHAPEPLQESMGRQKGAPVLHTMRCRWMLWMRTLHVRLMRDLDEQRLQRWRSEFGAFFRKR